MGFNKLLACVSVMVLAVAVLPVKAAVDGAAKNSEISLLQNAYVLLSQANHDYDGHRVKAMQSIHKAALLLKVNLQSKGDVHEDQSTSDAKLQEAQKLLKQARTFATGKSTRKFLKHLDTAIGHLSNALATK
jgi:hypothetical protein